MRVVKLFIIIIIYVGRYDTPVLAQGVGEIGPIKLDAFPFIFRQDLLAMDAHRHPYLERLGMMVRYNMTKSSSMEKMSIIFLTKFFLYHGVKFTTLQVHHEVKTWG